MARKRDGTSYLASQRLQSAFGRKLQDVREQKGILQKVLADKLGLSRTSISNIERGTHRVFLDQVYAAARALGEEPASLLPPLAEIYSDLLIHTPSDDPLSNAAAIQAQDVVRHVQKDLAEKHQVARGRSDRDRRR